MAHYNVSVSPFGRVTARLVRLWNLDIYGGGKLLCEARTAMALLAWLLSGQGMIAWCGWSLTVYGLACSAGLSITMARLVTLASSWLPALCVVGVDRMIVTANSDLLGKTRSEKILKLLPRIAFAVAISFVLSNSIELFIAKTAMKGIMDREDAVLIREAREKLRKDTHARFQTTASGAFGEARTTAAKTTDDIEARSEERHRRQASDTVKLEMKVQRAIEALASTNQMALDKEHPETKQRLVSERTRQLSDARQALQQHQARVALENQEAAGTNAVAIGVASVDPSKLMGAQLAAENAEMQRIDSLSDAEIMKQENVTLPPRDYLREQKALWKLQSDTAMLVTLWILRLVLLIMELMTITAKSFADPLKRYYSAIAQALARNDQAAEIVASYPEGQRLLEAYELTFRQASAAYSRVEAAAIQEASRRDEQGHHASLTALRAYVQGQWNIEMADPLRAIQAAFEALQGMGLAAPIWPPSLAPYHDPSESEVLSHLLEQATLERLGWEDSEAAAHEFRCRCAALNLRRHDLLTSMGQVTLGLTKFLKSRNLTGRHPTPAECSQRLTEAWDAPSGPAHQLRRLEEYEAYFGPDQLPHWPADPRPSMGALKDRFCRPSVEELQRLGWGGDPTPALIRLLRSTAPVEQESAPPTASAATRISTVLALPGHANWSAAEEGAWAEARRLGLN